MMIKPTKTKIVIFITLFVLSVCGITAFCFYHFYYSKINFYGEFKLEVLQDGRNVSDKFQLNGISIFNQKLKIARHNEFFVNKNTSFFKDIEIVLLDTAFINENILIKMYDCSINQEIYSINLELNSISISGLLNGIENDKKLNSVITGLVQVIHQRIFRLLLLSFVMFFVTLLVINSKQKRTNKILILLSLFFLFIFLIQVIVFKKQYVYSGVFLLLSIFLIIVFLVNGFVRADSTRKINVITVLATIFFTIIICELSLRLFQIRTTAFEKRFGYYESFETQNRVTQYHLREKYAEYFLENDEFRFVRTSNSLGLSDKEPEKIKMKNEYRIIALGDSFTEGDGAHADSTWVKFLERKMPQNDSVFYSFINAGICGSDPFYEYKLLKNVLIDYSPDLVIVTYGFDFDDVLIRGGMERFDSEKTKILSPWWEGAYSVSFIFRLFIHNILGHNDMFLSNKRFEIERERSINQLKESLVLFSELAKMEDFELLIVFYPQVHEVIERKFTHNQDLILHANSINVNNIDLLEYFLNSAEINETNVHNYYWKYDGHHNAAGYEKFADGILWHLENSGISLNP